MAIFYFNLYDRGMVVLDDEGLDLADWDKARSKGIEAARSIMSHEVVSGVLPLASYIDIVSDHETQVLRIDFKDAVSISS